MKSGTGNTLGAGCLILFAVPFAAIGTGALVGFVRAVRNGADVGGMAVMGIVGMAFALFGYGLMAGALIGLRRARQTDERRERHPGQPWMWNDQWASRRLTDSNRRSTLSLWLIAVFWNAVSAPMVFLVPRELEKENYVVLVGAIFPVAGLILLGAAVRGTMRVLRFPRSTLLLEHVPVERGGVLRGRLEVPWEPLADAESIIIRLTATNRVRSGKSTTESIVCQEDLEVPRGSVSRMPEGVSIPVAIGVPREGPETHTEGNPQATWRLTVDAEVPGIDYHASFDVPVFGMAEGPQLRRGVHVPPPEPREPADFVSRQTAAGRELYFGRFRARGAAVGMLFMTLAWSVIVAVLFAVEAPLFFTAVFSLFEVLMVWGTLDLFFGTSTIVLGRDQVIVRTRLFGTREKVIRRDEIASAAARIGPQGAGRPYYEVEVRTRGGKKVGAAKYLRSKREAEWVAAQIHGAIDSPA